jgi:hypothetical protein
MPGRELQALLKPHNLQFFNLNTSYTALVSVSGFCRHETRHGKESSHTF